MINAITPLWVSMPIIRNIVIMASANRPQAIEKICKEGNIKISDLDRADLKLSLEQNCSIMDAALTVSADEYLGLHIGEKTAPSVLGATGHLIESSRDVLSALHNVQAFTGSFTQRYSFQIVLSMEKHILRTQLFF